MKVELFLDEGEEYPQLFSVWRVDQKTGRADLTTRRNYVDDKKGWDKWRETDDENIRLKAENAKLREELEQWHKLTAGIELPEYPITQFQPKDLERENAKLRNEVELTKRMYAKVSEDLCAEQADNERLRQELAICEESEQEKCIEYLRQENIDWEDRYRDLVKENAKLRELALDMYLYHKDGFVLSDEIVDEFARQLSELGIEVE